MHFLALVIIPAEGDPAELVEAMMAPHQEDFDDDTDRLTGWWDWFQIGGRFTGCLDGYKPNDDPANIETCTLCGGTGKRLLALDVAYGCNGCRGEGKRAKWPTSWKSHLGDVQPATVLADRDPSECYVVLSEHGCTRRDGQDADGHWIERDAATFGTEAAALFAKAAPTERVVVVDCHS